MFVVVDRAVGKGGLSGIWDPMRDGLTQFFEEPSSAGLGVALRFFPDDTPVTGCSSPDCNTSACSVPLIETGQLSTQAAPADRHEQLLIDALATATEASSTPPIHPALGGALEYARSRPIENISVVLVSTHPASGCVIEAAQIAMLASDALEAGVTTYALGFSSDFGTAADQDLLDQIAMAGGTEAAHFYNFGAMVGSATIQEAVVTALKTILEDIRVCEFGLPETEMELPVDHSLRYEPTSGDPVILSRVESAGGCDDSNAWYYDDVANPTRIFVCPSACQMLPVGASLVLETACRPE
jgi:hypothetical protein